MTECWSRDLLESDRRYFEAGAELVPIPGAVIAVLPGAANLAAGSVVQRIDAEAAAADAEAWISLVEEALRDLGVPRARLYLDDPHPHPALDAALRARGYRPRAEHGFTKAAASSEGFEIELVPADDERSWSVRRELMDRQNRGVDGHPIDADLWIELERRKHAAGYLRPYLIRAGGRIAGAVCAARCGALLRMKNLVVDADFRRRGVATATAIRFAGIAREEGLEATGCYALAGEPGLVIYPRAGYGAAGVQTEWVRELG